MPAAAKAYNDQGIVQQGLRAIRQAFGQQVYLVTDVCMCEYTSHGHCGILDGQTVDNDKTFGIPGPHRRFPRPGRRRHGGPFGYDGRPVLAIRQALDANGLQNTPILSYAVKYASSFYGPFRDAAGSAPSFGDRKTYQMDCHNWKEALKEAATDEQEGADLLMVKPALAYLDVIREVSRHTNLPLAAYSVSGEYAHDQKRLRPRA